MANSSMMDIDTDDCVIEVLDNDAILKWDRKQKRKWISFIANPNNSDLEEALVNYLKIVKCNTIKFENKLLLKAKILNHLKIFHECYMVVQKQTYMETCNYLDHVESLLLFICQLEFEIICRTGKRGIEKYTKQSAQSIISTLCIYLSNDLTRIFHVLLKLEQKYGPQSWLHVMGLIYKYFLSTVPMADYSSESYCRNFLLFQRWQAITEEEERSGISKVLHFRFKRPKNLTKNDDIPSILLSCVDSRTYIKRDYDTMITAYFHYMETKKNDESNDLQLANFDSDSDEQTSLQKLFNEECSSSYLTEIQSKQAEPEQVVNIDDDDDDCQIVYDNLPRNSNSPTYSRSGSSLDLHESENLVNTNTPGVSNQETAQTLTSLYTQKNKNNQSEQSLSSNLLINEENTIEEDQEDNEMEEVNMDENQTHEEEKNVNENKSSQEEIGNNSVQAEVSNERESFEMELQEISFEEQCLEKEVFSGNQSSEEEITVENNSSEEEISVGNNSVDAEVSNESESFEMETSTEDQSVQETSNENLPPEGEISNKDGSPEEANSNENRFPEEETFTKDQSSEEETFNNQSDEELNSNPFLEEFFFGENLSLEVEISSEGESFEMELQEIFLEEQCLETEVFNGNQSSEEEISVGNNSVDAESFEMETSTEDQSAQEISNKDGSPEEGNSNDNRRNNEPEGHNQEMTESACDNVRNRSREDSTKDSEDICLPFKKRRLSTSPQPPVLQLVTYRFIHDDSSYPPIPVIGVAEIEFLLKIRNASNIPMNSSTESNEK